MSEGRRPIDTDQQVHVVTVIRAGEDPTLFVCTDPVAVDVCMDEYIYSYFSADEQGEYDMWSRLWKKSPETFISEWDATYGVSVRVHVETVVRASHVIDDMAEAVEGQ